MQTGHVQMISAAKYRELQGDARDGPELWARKDTERGPVELIEDRECEDETELCA